MRPADERYFERLETRLGEAMEVASEARGRGEDPSPEVEIPIAKDMADRVENILGIEGVAERVRELEGRMSREEAALSLATDFAEERVGEFETREGRIEGAVRTAVALLTEGVVAAPIEGIDGVEILTNDDGTEFVNVYYAGPIRSAGGTAQALSVLVADYTRALLGIGEYDARDDEVERYAEEIALYDGETGLQYTPKDEETKFIARNLPVMLDGEATGDDEVSGFRDLERVDTNNARGGMCLVLAEGIAQKAPKIERYTSQLEEVDWPWLDDLIEGTIGEPEDTSAPSEADSDGEGGSETEPEVGEGDGEEPEGPVRVDPMEKFLQDLIAGRPVFSHPSRAGGFRLRYGRARNHGFATAGVHPATMHVVDDFLATGTQIKTERPGKAAGVIPVDSIEGPTVRLANGVVKRIDDPEEALELRNGVDAILDVGEYLVNYGEFVENNHALAPASYAYEWWIQEFSATDAPVEAMADDPRIDLEAPSPAEAIEWAIEHDAPLHPSYTCLWHDLSVPEFRALADAVEGAKLAQTDGAVEPGRSSPAVGRGGTLVIERTEETRRALETLLVPHVQEESELRVGEWKPLVRSLGLDETLSRTWETLSERAEGWPNAMRAVNEVAPFTVRERAPTRIGNRMGRPEKSESRDLSPAVHTLFPIGEAGGTQRDVTKATHHAPEMNSTPGLVSALVGRRECTDCGEFTYRNRCPSCDGRTEPSYFCEDCEIDLDPDEAGHVICPRCEREGTTLRWETIDLDAVYHEALTSIGEREGSFEILKGVKGLTSEFKTPEPMAKGVLRAKHGVSTFKDGTVRYDMTDLPVTAVKPEELDVTVDEFRELGYHEDVEGETLRHDDQLVELRVQDVVLSDGAAEHMMRTADFVDDLLTRYYGLEPFYDVDEREDLVGELVFGMAPHTSAAVVGRVIGFTSAAVGYAHPYFHAAKRRNCFHPETKLWYREGSGGWRYDSIERFVEERLEDPERDDVGTLVQELDGEVVVPSIDDDGGDLRATVEGVSKHPAPDHLVEVETRSGRTLTVTAEHEMLRWDDGPERIEASRIEPGDAIPSPQHIAVDGSPEHVDVLESLLVSGSIPDEDLVVRGLGSERLKELLDRATPSEQYLEPVAERLGVGTSTVYNWVGRDSVPVSVLVELFGRAELLEIVPKDVELGVRRDSTTVKRTIEIEDEVASLLGYYAAEGFARRTDGEYYQTTICTPDEEVRSTVIETFATAFGVDAYEENEWKVTVSSRLVAAVFVDVLRLGERAEEKRVPDPVVSGDDRIARAFLAAYFSGDGSVSSDRLDIRAHTVSEDLATGLIALLKRFGIAAKCYEERRRIHSGSVSEFYGDEAPLSESTVVKITSENAVRFAERVGFDLDRKERILRSTVETVESRPQWLFGDGGEVWLDEVVDVSLVESDVEYTYCLTVAETNALVANDLFVGQCDGDEDCIMLLMDGLLNFSKSYLPDKRGGRMDAPLVMSSRIDPAEIDDEAHNMDVVDRYPLEFYEATTRMADPGEVEIEIAEESLGTDDEYTGFRHTHETTDIHMGPALSAYKTLGPMMEKMDAQLELARKLRAVDETDVAERVIEYHFLPDLIGNLRAFSSQTTRCLGCGEKFRRMPLSSDCPECGGDVTLTVHQGSVSKYMDHAIRVAEQYDCREYTKQRLYILEKTLESVFEDDTNKQSGIADFM